MHCVRLKRRSPKLHHFGQAHGKLSSIGFVLLIRMYLLIPAWSGRVEYSHMSKCVLNSTLTNNVGLSVECNKSVLILKHSPPLFWMGKSSYSCIHFPAGSQKYICKRCSREYTYKTSLLKHVRQECGVEPRFLCQWCPYRAKQKCALQSHLHRKHYNKEPPL